MNSRILAAHDAIYKYQFIPVPCILNKGEMSFYGDDGWAEFLRGFAEGVGCDN